MVTKLWRITTSKTYRLQVLSDGVDFVYKSREKKGASQQSARTQANGRCGRRLCWHDEKVNLAWSSSNECQLKIRKQCFMFLPRLSTLLLPEHSKVYAQNGICRAETWWHWYISYPSFGNVGEMLCCSCSPVIIVCAFFKLFWEKNERRWAN